MPFVGHAGKWLDTKAKVIFKTEKNIITIRLLPNISRCKVNQTTKFGQLIECNTFFFQNHAKNESWRLVSDLLAFNKILLEVKAGGQHLIF